MLFDPVPLITSEIFIYQNTDAVDPEVIKSKQSSETLCHTQRPPEFD